MMDKDPLRTCIICGLQAFDESDIILFVKKTKGKYGYRNLCKKCRNSLYRKDGAKWSPHQVEQVKKWHQNHPDRVKEIKKKSHSKRITFKDKRIVTEKKVRTGVCTKCGNKVQTVIHHEKYDSANPLKNTIELCISCHNSIHRRMEIANGHWKNPKQI